MEPLGKQIQLIPVFKTSKGARFLFCDMNLHNPEPKIATKRLVQSDHAVVDPLVTKIPSIEKLFSRPTCQFFFYSCNDIKKNPPEI